MDFACLEMSILELWANDGKYDASTDEAIESLTNQDVLDKLNNFNKYVASQTFPRQYVKK